jgi:hypothetical protein
VIAEAPAWFWVETSGGLDELARRLATCRAVSLDTEGDSLHHYPARLSLVQLGVESGEAWLVDTLALGDLTPSRRSWPIPPSSRWSTRGTTTSRT